MTGRVLFLVLLLAGSASAQFDNQTTVHRVTVHVVFSDGGPCDASMRVTLTGRGGPSASGSPNRDCTIEFLNMPLGTYHLSVSGLHVTPLDNGSISIEAAGSTELEVKVERADGAARPDGAPGPPLVGVTELKVPSGARKEFDKASALMDKQNWAKAMQELNKAIAIYPSYTEAYTNLGVVYARMGDRNKEREALQKAISINDHFAPAYLNLGRMNIVAGDYPNAEANLNKAHSFDPADSMTMVLLAYVEFMDQHFDEAIATSRRAHSVPQGPHAYAHQIAARASEQKHDSANAIAELQMFLKEEPTGERADSARKELAGLQATLASLSKTQGH